MSNHSPFDDRDDLSGLARDVVRELKATSDLVADAARQGKDELLHYVSESIRSSWISSAGPDKPRESRTHYTEEFRKQQQDFDERRAARQKAETEKASAKQKKEKAQKIRQVSAHAGWWFLLGGLFFVPAVVGLGEAVVGLFSGLPVSVALTEAATGGLLGAFPLWKGLHLKKQEKLYDRYLSAVGSSPRIKLETLAALTHRSYGEAVKDVNDMVDRGYFGSEARFDAARGVLIVDPDAPEETPEPAPAPSSEPSDSYDAMLLELRLLNERIEDEEMSNRIYRIEAVAKATFLAVREKPEKRSQIQRFMDYYLPTTIKLLSAYADFEKQTVEGENIRKSKENIEHMTQTLSEAFEKQFDSLFRSETMDINAEIRTMDSLLRQDGYVGGIQMPK